MIQSLNRTRGSLTASMALAAVAAVTTLVAMYAWRGFAERPGGFLNPLLLLGVVVATTGTAARWWRWPTPVVLATQVVVSGLVALLLITGRMAPSSGMLSEARTAVGDAIDSAQAFAAPIPATEAPIDPLLVLCGLACLLLVDFLACSLHRVPLAGLPLLTIYTIPVSLVEAPISWWVFVGTAAGFLAMLFLQEAEHISRWGRPIAEDRETGDPIALGAGAHAVRRTAGGIGGAATALALVLPLAVPTVGLQLFDFGPGRGNGDDIRVDNPVANLVRDLQRGVDTDLVQVTTTDPAPAYLRLLALTNFTDAEWTPGDRDVPTGNRADGLIPPPSGVDAEVSRTEIPYDVTVLPEFESRWLPTQYPVSNVQAEGDWRFDDSTTDFLAVPDDLTTADLQYSMSALELELSAERLRNAAPSSGKVEELFTDYPADIPRIVRELAASVTQGKTTRFEKAVALQEWFRTDGGFTYSLRTAAEGNGADALVTFLSEGPGGRTGYCEQFASAMALMARVIGIPSRVAIGFLAPKKVGPSTWMYSSHDMHAWPELYFQGSGWVRFEPTPAGRAADVPTYTVDGLPDDREPTDPAQSQSATIAPPQTARPTQSADAAGEETGDETGDAGVSWGPILGVTGTVGLLGGVLLLPSLVRRRRRAGRLATGAPEEIWDELRDTALDLGVPWAPGRSPRQTRDVLTDYLGEPVGAHTVERPPRGSHLSPQSEAALGRVVTHLERLRYSRSPAASDRSALRADAETVIASLTGGSTRSARRRATWWPRSVLSLSSRRPARSEPATVEARYGGVVDHAG